MIVTLNSSRDEYSAHTAATRSITVGELIGLLGQYDDDDKVVFCNDNGFTYGYVTRYGAVGEIEEEEETCE